MSSSRRSRLRRPWPRRSFRRSRQAACIACTWRPEHLSQEPVITRLAQALGARLAW